MKNLYYTIVYQRRNVIQEGLLNLFIGISSWPRMLLEVPIRRNFGERYFNFWEAMMLTTLLALIPFGRFETFFGIYRETGVLSFLRNFLTWYAYLAVFVYTAFLRWDEVKRLPGVYDFARFSLSTGYIHPRFRFFSFNGLQFSRREVEILIEPGFFFLSGIILVLMKQPIGTVLLFSSIVYSMSYVAAYRQGDQYLMGEIDKRICAEELAQTFIDDDEARNSRGFEFYGRKPANAEARQRVADLFMQQDETVEAS